MRGRSHYRRSGQPPVQSYGGTVRRRCRRSNGRPHLATRGPQPSPTIGSRQLSAIERGGLRPHAPYGTWVRCRRGSGAVPTFESPRLWRDGLRKDDSRPADR